MGMYRAAGMVRPSGRRRRCQRCRYRQVDTVRVHVQFSRHPTVTGCSAVGARMHAIYYIIAAKPHASCRIRLGASGATGQYVEGPEPS